MGNSNADLQSFVSTADLSTKRYYVVMRSTTGKIAVATGATSKICGVLEDGGLATTVGCTVAKGGRRKVIAGGTVALNDRVKCDSTGRAITSSASTDHTLGFAVTASNAANQYIWVDVEIDNNDRK